MPPTLAALQANRIPEADVLVDLSALPGMTDNHCDEIRVLSVMKYTTVSALYIRNATGLPDKRVAAALKRMKSRRVPSVECVRGFWKLL